MGVASLFLFLDILNMSEYVFGWGYSEGKLRTVVFAFPVQSAQQLSDAWVPLNSLLLAATPHWFLGNKKPLQIAPKSPGKISKPKPPFP